MAWNDSYTYFQDFIFNDGTHRTVELWVHMKEIPKELSLKYKKVLSYTLRRGYDSIIEFGNDNEKVVIIIRIHLIKIKTNKNSKVYILYI